MIRLFAISPAIHYGTMPARLVWRQSAENVQTQQNTTETPGERLDELTDIRSDIESFTLQQPHKEKMELWWDTQGYGANTHEKASTIISELKLFSIDGAKPYEALANRAESAGLSVQLAEKIHDEVMNIKAERLKTSAEEVGFAYRYIIPIEELVAKSNNPLVSEMHNWGNTPEQSYDALFKELGVSDRNVFNKNIAVISSELKEKRLLTLREHLHGFVEAKDSMRESPRNNLLVEVASGKFGSVLNKFQQATPSEKAMYAAAAVAGIYAVWKTFDFAFKEHPYISWGVMGAFSANVMSGMLSEDNTTFLEKTFTDQKVDPVSRKMLHIIGESGNAESARVMLELSSSSLTSLYETYRGAGSFGAKERNREKIHTRRLAREGRAERHYTDPEKAYEVTDLVFRDLGRKYYEEAAERGGSLAQYLQAHDIRVNGVRVSRPPTDSESQTQLGIALFMKSYEAVGGSATMGEVLAIETRGVDAVHNNLDNLFGVVTGALSRGLDWLGDETYHLPYRIQQTDAMAGLLAEKGIHGYEATRDWMLKQKEAFEKAVQQYQEDNPDVELSFAGAAFEVIAVSGGAAALKVTNWVMNGAEKAAEFVVELPATVESIVEAIDRISKNPEVLQAREQLSQHLDAIGAHISDFSFEATSDGSAYIIGIDGTSYTVSSVGNFVERAANIITASAAGFDVWTDDPDEFERKFLGSNAADSLAALADSPAKGPALQAASERWFRSRFLDEGFVLDYKKSTSFNEENSIITVPFIYLMQRGEMTIDLKNSAGRFSGILYDSDFDEASNDFNDVIESFKDSIESDHLSFFPEEMRTALAEPATQRMLTASEHLNIPLKTFLSRMYEKVDQLNIASSMYPSIIEKMQNEKEFNQPLTGGIELVNGDRKAVKILISHDGEEKEITLREPLG